MKITKRHLRRLIKEEFDQSNFPYREGDEIQIQGIYEPYYARVVRVSKNGVVVREQGEEFPVQYQDIVDNTGPGTKVVAGGIVKEMRITKRQLKRIIRESLLTEAVPGTLGKWIDTERQVWIPAEDQKEKPAESRGPAQGKNAWVTEWWLPVRGEYGGLVIGSIQFFVPGYHSREDAKPGWRWRIHNKDWKGFKVNKHIKLLKNANRDAYPKGEFIQNYDPDFGESMKGEVEAAVVAAGGVMKGDIDTSKPPPAAAALVQGTKDIPGVKVGETSADGVSVSYELKGVTGAGARAQLKKLLQPLGFSGFNPGRYMGGGMAFGYGGGGPQKTISAAFDQGGKIFAEFSTSTTFGEKTTRVGIEAEWSSDERS
jgi:hypothetical protein